MAKCGEGDPRWIVEERSDAHNVNNWHWREKDATDWSKKKLHELFKGLKIEEENIASCWIQDITSCEGEASVSNRKKKIICFYDFELKAKWKGKMKDSNITYSGQLEIPNLGEENDADEVDVTIFFGKDDRNCHELKEFMRKKGVVVIREKIQEFMDSLRSDCASTIQVPTNGETIKASDSAVVKDAKAEMNKVTTQVKAISVGAKLHTKKLIMSETFMTSVEEFFKTLTLKDRISAWSRSKVESDAASGESFSLFDGNVTGEYLSIVKDERIQMRWRFKNWPEAHFSTVTMTFKQTSEGAKLELEQSGVPESNIEATKSGWKNYYWRSIKMTFGYGATIL